MGDFLSLINNLLKMFFLIKGFISKRTITYSTYNELFNFCLKNNY